jgi:hypothetical protein
MTGCAGDEGFKKAMDATVGTTEVALVDRLGPPDTTYRVDGDDSGAKYLTWRKTGRGPANAYNPAYCSMTFRVDRYGVVQSYRYDGTTCNDSSSAAPHWFDVVGMVLAGIGMVVGGILLAP